MTRLELERGSSSTEAAIIAPALFLILGVLLAVASFATGSARVIDPTTIEVTVTSSEDTVFLGLIGIHSVSATRTARVDLIQGQTEVLP